MKDLKPIKNYLVHYPDRYSLELNSLLFEHRPNRWKTSGTALILAGVLAATGLTGCTKALERDIYPEDGSQHDESLRGIQGEESCQDNGVSLDTGSIQVGGSTQSEGDSLGGGNTQGSSTQGRDYPEEDDPDTEDYLEKFRERPLGGMPMLEEEIRKMPIENDLANINDYVSAANSDIDETLPEQVKAFVVGLKTRGLI
ncbi:MAG: hypothetical protein FWG40_02735 [Peptococcaceae bacterium]|nr:hypothetical protein [Peptococcaceae bacterium]